MTVKIAPKPRRSGRLKAAVLLAAALAILVAVAVTRLGRIVAAVLIGVPVLVVAVIVARAWWKRYASGGRMAAWKRRKYQGWATARDLIRARNTAAALTRRICPGSGLLVLGHARKCTVAVCRENSVLYVGPPGSGKTGALACHVLDAPGLAFSSSTKTETFLDTVEARSRLGPVWVLNADGHGGIPSTLRWSPVAGCEDATVALRRAGDFAAAAPKDGKKDADYWTAKGAGLIAVMLHAAALSGATMREAAAWTRDPWTPVIAEIYNLPAADGVLGHKLMSLLSGAGEHLSGVMGAAEAAVAWMDDPAMEAAACPPPGQGFDPAAFARGTGTAYLITRKRPYGSAAPYCAALGAEVFEQLRAYALEHASGRLPVPATFVLDELPLTCPLPVHDMLADARGYLITIAAGFQSYSQLRTVWGQDAGDTIRSAAPVEVILGGEKRAGDLEALSEVIGCRDTWHGSMGDLRTERLMPPEALRSLAKGRAVILAPECRPVLADLPAIWQRPGYRRASLAGAAAMLPQPALEAAPERPAIPIHPDEGVLWPASSASAAS